MKTVTTLWKTLLPLAILAVLIGMAPAAHAQAPYAHDIQGIWTFFVSIDGAPPCECIQLSRFYPDGTLDGPGNDQFTGAGLGVWSSNGAHVYTFAITQNSFNPDGSAGGVWVIRGTMTITSDPDTATGTSTAQLLDNSGAVIVSATAKFKATRLRP